MNLNDALKYSTDGRTHADFVDAALANPESQVHPLAYADWLQEQGQEGLAEHLRGAVTWAQQGSKLTFPAFGGRSSPEVSVASFSNNDVVLNSVHPSSGQKAAMYNSKHTPEEAVDIVGKMKGLAGQERAETLLKAKFPHLYPAPAPAPKPKE